MKIILISWKNEFLVFFKWICWGDWEVGVDCVFIYGNYGNKKFEIEIFYIFLLLNLYINNII